MMELEISEKKQNPLLSRWEVRFVVQHPNEKTPSRDAIREKLAGTLSAKKANVVVDSMNSVFGKGTTKGYARVYDAPEQLAKNEPHYILKRNKLEELKPKKVKKEAEPAAAKKAAPKK
jgi:small subunit ribosomal protein S24e